MNTKRIPFHETLRRDSEATQNRKQKKQAHKNGMIAISLPATQPSPCIYWYTITWFREGGGGDLVRVGMRTAEGH